LFIIGLPGRQAQQKNKSPASDSRAILYGGAPAYVLSTLT
jgi:hypothetical protein